MPDCAPIARAVAAVFVVCAAASGQTFRNPLFASQDPWVVYDNGIYYYSESYCGIATICIKSAPTLTGLATANWVGVWNAPPTGPNSADVWAPELHKINGAWYLYYAADTAGNNDTHRLFVLQANSGNPLGSWSTAATGGSNGLLADSTGHWAIDPDVFTAADGRLYITWSCTNSPTSVFPQATCLARMSDPLHITGATAQISTPTERWETRTAAIQEGPVGFVHNGATYITYSASASWTDNDYAVGLLTNQGGDLLDSRNWLKQGPIFDHHGSAYGVGSVVFIPSPDNKETWVLYHGIDSLTCNPSYSCRDIRMQKMFWASDGTPVLGYPLNPGVSVPVPSGEQGYIGSGSSGSWGSAFGDAAEGNGNSGNVVGTWLPDDATTIHNTTLGAVPNQVFSISNPNFENYTVNADVQRVQTGTSSRTPKYGIYAAYSDTNNFVAVWFDTLNDVVITNGAVGGVPQPPQTCTLAAGFDASVWNNLQVKKTGSTFAVAVNGVQLIGPCNGRTFNLLNGQIGLTTEDTEAKYRNVVTVPTGPAFTSSRILNSASYTANGVAPGELVAIFGSGLGPVDGVAAGLEGNPPALPTRLAGTQVLFDGLPAPLLYVSSKQVNVQAPYEISSRHTTLMQVTYDGDVSLMIPVPVLAADPGMYVAVNYDDGTINSQESPVMRGHIVIIYATGQGSVDPPVATGQPAPVSPLSHARNAAVNIGGLPASVGFAGMTPNFAGLLQLNVTVPGNAPTGQPDRVEITINGITRQTGAVWVK